MPRWSPVRILVLGALLFVVLQQIGVFDDPVSIVIRVVALTVAITVHEANHALAAVKLGDPTPQKMGRLSLNPLRHLDPVGTMLLFIASFGWGKPVMFNPQNLRGNQALGSALVSAAGPVANLVTAFLVAGLLDLTPQIGLWWVVLLRVIVAVNIALAVFNLLPIPPLDGFGVLTGVVPRPIAQALAPLYNYGPLILLGLVFLPQMGGPNVLGQVMFPVIDSLTDFALHLR